VCILCRLVLHSSDAASAVVVVLAPFGSMDICTIHAATAVHHDDECQ
jgi:hypothetical protein